MNETDLGPIDLTILHLDEQGRLGYLRPSDEWFVDGEPVPHHWQLYCDRLFQAGFLPRFMEVAS
jgi:hypothetical protein